MEKIEVPGSKAYRLVYPRLVVLVSCIDPETGKPNIITIAWAAPLSARPPLVGILVAPHRYSHELISKSREFVINLPPVEILDKAIKCGRTSGRRHDKFSEFGLTAKPAKTVKSPIIEECVAHLECKLADQLTMGDHTLFVGEVVAAYANEGMFDGESMNPEKFHPIYQVSGDSYATLREEILKPEL
ncbi:MAG: flavin reductase family protein [Hadesarchaea archaeon]|nr:flavin reductase family protein [Hadesarchaea archaeon]